MIKKCCVCRMVKIDGRWQEAQSCSDRKKVTHVYCPDCYRRTMNKINRLGGIGRINQPAPADFAHVA